MISVSLFVRIMTTAGTTAGARRPAARVLELGGAVGPVQVQQRVCEAHARGVHVQFIRIKLPSRSRPVLQSISYTHSVGTIMRDSSKTSFSSARPSHRSPVPVCQRPQAEFVSSENSGAVKNGFRPITLFLAPLFRNGAKFFLRFWEHGEHSEHFFEVGLQKCHFD